MVFFFRNADVVLMRKVCKDDLRAYLILLQVGFCRIFTLVLEKALRICFQNPQFRKSSTYVVCAHLLRQIATLCDHDHHRLAEYFAQ